MARESASLTQREIEALLSEGDAATSAAPHLYDFRNPDKLSKEQVRGLQNIQQLVSSVLAGSLSGRLRTLVEARFSALQPGLADEYVSRIGEHSCVAVVDMRPLDGLAFIAFDAVGAFEMINRVLGGTSRGRPAPDRELTPIELAIMCHIAADAATALMEPWERIAQIEPEVTGVYVPTEIMQILSPSAPVLTAWYEVKFFGLTSAVSYCYPVPLLEQVAAKFAGQSLYREMGASAREAGRPITADHLLPLIVPIRSVLGTARLDAIDVASLAKGDVVVLDRKVSDALPLFVGDASIFSCRPGIHGTHVAVEVVEGESAIGTA